MNYDNCNSQNGTNGMSVIAANTAKRKAENTRVLSTKVSSEDYGAYKEKVRAKKNIDTNVIS